MENFFWFAPWLLSDSSLPAQRLVGSVPLLPLRILVKCKLSGNIWNAIYDNLPYWILLESIGWYRGQWEMDIYGPKKWNDFDSAIVCCLLWFVSVLSCLVDLIVLSCVHLQQDCEIRVRQGFKKINHPMRQTERFIFNVLLSCLCYSWYLIFSRFEWL